MMQPATFDIVISGGILLTMSAKMEIIEDAVVGVKTDALLWWTSPVRPRPEK